MGRVYANEEETGRRVLLRLECDEPGCPAGIKPNPDIARSGWKKHGSYDAVARQDVAEFIYCPEHAP